jgi:hypothetical protein
VSRSESGYSGLGESERSVLEREALRMKQGKVLIAHGFHTQLGLSEEAYLQTLPKFEPQPEEYKGRFDIPVLVDPRVDLLDQHKSVNLKGVINRVDLENLVEVPDKPYVMWTHDGRRNRQKSVVEAQAGFADDEVGSTQLEVTALFLQHPDVFEGHALYAPNSRSERHVPYLHRIIEGHKARLGRGGKDDRPHALWGTLSRGEKISQ